MNLPSLRYESAQQVSASTSASLWKRRRDRTGRAGDTWTVQLKNLNCKVNARTFEKSGGGFFPLQRLLRAQTALRVIDSRVDLVSSVRRGLRMPWSST